jgi:hypothetical protein
MSIAGIGLSFQGPRRRWSRSEGRRKLGAGGPLVKHHFQKTNSGWKWPLKVRNSGANVQCLGVDLGSDVQCFRVARGELRGRGSQKRLETPGRGAKDVFQRGEPPGTKRTGAKRGGRAVPGAPELPRSARCRETRETGERRRPTRQTPEEAPIEAKRGGRSGSGARQLRTHGAGDEASRAAGPQGTGWRHRSTRALARCREQRRVTAEQRPDPRTIGRVALSPT